MKKKRIAAIGDLHVHLHDNGRYSGLFRQISEEADILVLCGDLTDTGSVEEAKILAEDLKQCTIPVVGVLGNHDYEQGNEQEITEILQSNTVNILEGTSVTIEDIGFVGLKGFAGGFGKYMLAAWGEKIIKDFVQEAVNDVMKLERELRRLDTKNKIVLLHYAPIRDTVVGEPEEIFPFLGSSRLAEPINRFEVTMAFHGHAHHGTFEGKTSKDIPVYNVSQTIVKNNKEGKEYAIFEV
jgi:Icc-related predicted phosphoesterase